MWPTVGRSAAGRSKARARRWSAIGSKEAACAGATTGPTPSATSAPCSSANPAAGTTSGKTTQIDHNHDAHTQENTCAGSLTSIARRCTGSAMSNQPRKQRGKLAIEDHANPPLPIDRLLEKIGPGSPWGGVREELEEGDSGPKSLQTWGHSQPQRGRGHDWAGVSKNLTLCTDPGLRLGE
jgi:hypothetical protein